MDDSLNARLHFDDAGNIVADTTQGQILIVRRAQGRVHKNDGCHMYMPDFSAITRTYAK